MLGFIARLNTTAARESGINFEVVPKHGTRGRSNA
jgi:hypothetical protein